MIKCEHVSLSFQDKRVFDDLNFEIESGANASVSGESGKGKSSILKLLQGYILPDTGTISINGAKLSARSINQIRNSIAWIPQNINLPVHTGIKLMHLLGISERKESVYSFLDKLGLEEEFLHADFQKISGGQKQRIVISICLSLDREIILMDEPTSSLDDASIQLLINAVKTLSNKTILSASHNHAWIKNSNQVIEL